MKNQVPLLLSLGFLLFTACGRREVPAPENPPETGAVQAPSDSAGSPLRDIPSPPGTQGYTVTGNNDRGSVEGQSAQSIADIEEFYASELPGAGWILVSSTARDHEHQMEFREGPRPRARALQIRLSPVDDATTATRVQLEWGAAKNSDLDLESYEPEPEEPSDVDGGAREW